jgi:hypothetical protein
MAANPIRFDQHFEKAADAIVFGSYDELKALLEATPSLVHQRSPYGHQAGLIHYVGSNGVETWRQIVPHNLAAITQLLLDYGANPNMTSNIYGHTVGVVPLLKTSAHPWEAGIAEAVLAVLQ